MVATTGQITDYVGTSSDDKPTSSVNVNSLFLELDTGEFYYFTGEGWEKVGGQS